MSAQTTAPVKPRRTRGGDRQLRGLLPLVIVLVVWQLVGDAKSPYFPPPFEWWTALGVLAEGGKLFASIGSTLTVFLISLAIATVLGTAAGAVLGKLPRTDRAFGPSVEFFRNMPAPAVLPVFTLLLGFQLNMEIALVVFVSIWPVMLSVRSAVLQMDPLLDDVGATLRLSRFARFKRILLPSLTPGIALGVRIAAPLALIVTLLAEILTNMQGIGSLMMMAQSGFEAAQVWALITIAGLIGLVVNVIVSAMESSVFRRHGIDRAA